MKGKWKQILRSRRGFTLLECVLATAIASAGAALLMGMITLSYGFITRSRSLDSIAAVAQEAALVYDGRVEVTEGLKQTSADSGVYVGYSDKLNVQVAYEITYGKSGKKEVVIPSTYEFVAVVVTDNNDNKIVYYQVSPNESKISGLYQDKQ